VNTKPTYQTTAPVQIGPYTSWNRHEQEFKRERSPMPDRVDVLPGAFDAPAHVSPQAVASIQKAFTLSKTSHNAWRSYKREGRFDPRRAAGASRLDQDVFMRKTGQSTTRVKCAVLIDGSGSMNDDDTARLPNPENPTGKRRHGVKASMAAAVFGCTIARALGSIPTVDLDVYQHSAGTAGDLYMKWRWHKGTPLGVFNEAVQMRPGGGNADGHALFAIIEKMRREMKRGERGVIMVVSDGKPSVYSLDGDPTATGNVGAMPAYRSHYAATALTDAVKHGRKYGIEIIAVAVDGSDQSVFYGKDGVIPFLGDWGTLGRELAQHIGKALARR
jgi:Mg-chelatase subunit ChlD